MYIKIYGTISPSTYTRLSVENVRIMLEIPFLDLFGVARNHGVQLAETSTVQIGQCLAMSTQ